MPLPPNPDLADQVADDILKARRSGPLFREQLAEIIRKLLPVPPVPTVEMIYQAYPRKIGRTAAEKAIGQLLKNGCAAGHLLERTQAYAGAVAHWNAGERQYCPHPATWFNQGRYDDDPKEWRRGAAPFRQATTL